MRIATAFALGLLFSCSLSDDYDPTTSASGGGGGGVSCCKVCKNSKACGDSCIATNKTCNTGGGCACLETDPRLELDLVAEETSTT